MLCRATQHGRVVVESSDRMWSTREENGKPLQYSCLENPMNSMKRSHKPCQIQTTTKQALEDCVTLRRLVIPHQKERKRSSLPQETFFPPHWAQDLPSDQ